jgi:hypothetical protein
MSDTPPIYRNTVLAQGPEQVSCDLDGETVLMRIEDGMYYAMNVIGSRIWALLEHPRQVAAICHLLAQEYDVEPAQCEQDVLAFLEELTTCHLLTVVYDTAT